MASYRLAKSLETLRAQVNTAWPKRNKASDGWIGDPRHRATASDHNPGQDGIVRALDITHDPANGVDCGLIAESIKDDPRVKYVIWNRRIYNPSKLKAWRDYYGVNPHNKHSHISVRLERVYFDSVAPWNIEGVIESPGGPVVTPSPIVRPLLKRGSKGQEVKNLQAMLLGITVDGKFGPKTEAAVRAFQGATGMRQDGKVGPLTWDQLAQRAAYGNPTPILQLSASLKAKNHLHSFEQLRLEAYSLKGIWHIGWGRSNSSGKLPKIHEGLKITREQADAMFLDDLADVERYAKHYITLTMMTQGQFDAMVSIIFNKGPTWFKDSNLLVAVNKGDWAAAKKAILADVPEKTSKIYKGILRRRQAEVAFIQ